MRLERWAFVSPIVLGSSLAAQGPALEHQASGSTARLQAVSAVSPLVVWVSGARGTYARTTDGGKTWHSAVVPGADSLEFRDVHAASADTAWLLSAGPGERSRIYHTTDAGRTWVLQFTNTNAQAFFDCLSFWDARRGLAVSDAVNGEFIVIRTDDGGAHWEPVPATSLPPARPGEGMFAASGTCLAVRGDSLAWFGTGAGRTARVVRTTDGGRTWAAVETPIVHEPTTAGITSLIFFDSRNGLALGGDLAITDRPTDNVAVTGDGGSSWALTGRPTFPGPVYGAAAVPVRARWVVAVGPKGASWSDDGGRTWRPLADGDYWSVGFAPDATGWMVGPEGRITRVDFGTDVQPWKPAGISSPEFESHAAFDPRTGDLWFVRSSLPSSPAGESWSVGALERAGPPRSPPLSPGMEWRRIPTSPRMAAACTSSPRARRKECSDAV